jgi:23S rRNA (uracil1939-C5)-methyltransferase
LQIYLQSGGLDSVRPLQADVPPLRYAVDQDAVAIEFGPIDFIQINREINVSMVAAAVGLLEPSPPDAVLDLFCGLGNFTLPLARRAQRVVGVEGDAALIEKAQGNAARNGIGNAAFFRENLFEPQNFGAWAGEWRPRRIAYISCHPASLARDAGILVHTQGFELTCAGVMDMFPHTTHVESIAVFERAA